METNLCNSGKSACIKLKDKQKDLQSYSHNNRRIAKSGAVVINITSYFALDLWSAITFRLRRKHYRPHPTLDLPVQDIVLVSSSPSFQTEKDRDSGK
jgi:hypothetical protein